MRILFVTSNRLGDAVLSTGLLDHLIHAHPDARITIACGPVAEGVFARMPNHERTIVLDKRSYSMHWLPLWASAATTLWDLVVDIRGSALAWMVPTRRRAVKRRCAGGHAGQVEQQDRSEQQPPRHIHRQHCDQPRHERVNRKIRSNWLGQSPWLRRCEVP